MILKAGTYRFNDVIESNGISVSDNVYYIQFISNGILFNRFRFLMTNGSYDISFRGDDDADDLYNSIMGWNQPEFQIVTLETDQTVDDAFGNWFISNTNYNEVNASALVTIEYNGSTIAELNAGETATLGCAELKMRTDVVVKVNKVESGTGGGECSGNHIIEVEELPTVGEEGATYRTTKITDIVGVNLAFNMVVSFTEQYSSYGMTMHYHYAATRPTDDIIASVEPDIHIYYVEDEDVFLMYNGSDWQDMSEMSGVCVGVVTDTSDLPCDGAYLVGAPLYYHFVNGEYREYKRVKKLFGFSSNGDGTCSICSAGTYGTTRNVVVPSVAPNGDSVTMIGNNAFSGNIGIQTITISEGVKSNDYGSFRNCTGLTKVIFPDSYTTIANQTFDECYALAEVVLGKGIKSIGMYAFDNCKSLKTITYNGTVAEWGNITLNDNWNNNVPATEVTCSDGTVTL